jgi:hypothetical protein
MGNETREEREELKALSTEIFGVPSRYRKLYEGMELITHKVAEVVPGENGAPDETKLVEVPELKNGVKQYRSKYRTTEEVLALLREFKAKRDAFLAEMEKTKAAERVKKETEEALKNITGSALS